MDQPATASETTRPGAGLDAVLREWAAREGAREAVVGREAVADTVLALAAAAARLADVIARGPLEDALQRAGAGRNAGGDVQQSLDLRADAEVRQVLERAPVAYYASEEEDAIVTLRAGAPVAVVVDPLHGSSNIDVNVPVGTIFSIFQSAPEGATASFLRAGAEQAAAGYFVYGPHTALVLTVGDGTAIFVREPGSGAWRLARAKVAIAPSTRELAIDASNYRHWSAPVRTFIDDCVEGAEGPCGKDFNMRWVASLVAETHRIFTRGGVFLYPADRRPGYGQGRLRLVYEAAPIAMLVEQAGGRATDGVDRILDKVPEALRQRTPLVFGSAEKVDRIAAYHVDPAFARDVSPLFRERGLFRS